ncbi:MAG: PfkB family carbohydrate kinase [Bacteroidia bacterium]|nr:PfkB family carbohydrate kinase [Bacteroidia bacterium]
MQDKIVALEDLAVNIERWKAEGKSVALCHGCFDLLHLGHIKHFEAAAKAADVLVVTLTPDHLVNKGPGRPVFNQNMRAESIAALESVRNVAINTGSTAIELLKMLKPTYYIKGSDYKNFEEDLTGNIRKEVEAVRSVGGDIYFTDEVTFSSSKLINAHFNPLGEQAKEFLDDLKGKTMTDEIISWVEKLDQVRVLVIGDTIVDEYHYVQPLGKSSKSPTLSTKFQRAECFAGGVLAIANHLNQFAASVEMVTMLGRQNDQMEIISPKVHPKVKARYFYREDGPTPTKRRYMTEYLNTKIFEVTFMNDSFLPASLESEMIAYLDTVIGGYDVVLISDFGHGLISPAIQRWLTEQDVFVAVNAQTNSNNYGYNYITKYHGVDYISIDENEIRLPFGSRHGKIEDLIHRLYEATGCPKISITLGSKGALYFDNGVFHDAPALATSVVDSVGAGDAVLSVTSLLSYLGCPAHLIPFIGNAVGALAVQILGNERPVTKVELNKSISHMLK